MGLPRNVIVYHQFMWTRLAFSHTCYVYERYHFVYLSSLLTSFPPLLLHSQLPTIDNFSSNCYKAGCSHS